MIFRTLFKRIWTIFDVLCYLFGAGCVIAFAFTFGTRYGLLAIGLTLFLTGFISELISGNQPKNGGE